MLSLPNVRKLDDNDLAKSPSNSEETLALKYKEWMRQQWEVRECREREEHD